MLRALRSARFMLPKKTETDRSHPVLAASLVLDETLAASWARGKMLASRAQQGVVLQKPHTFGWKG